MAIERIAVLGAGTMGHGIAHAALAAGYDTRMFYVSVASLAQGRTAIERILDKGRELGKLSANEAADMLTRLRTTSDLAEALDGVDFVIEAVPERLDLKLALFADIERLAPARSVVASNTSALCVSWLVLSPTRRARSACISSILSTR
jgi:3-hydroxyacyl-CoA dehydrogenase